MCQYFPSLLALVPFLEDSQIYANAVVLSESFGNLRFYSHSPGLPTLLQILRHPYSLEGDLRKVNFREGTFPHDNFSPCLLHLRQPPFHQDIGTPVYAGHVPSPNIWLKLPQASVRRQVCASQTFVYLRLPWDLLKLWSRSSKLQQSGSGILDNPPGDADAFSRLGPV